MIHESNIRKISGLAESLVAEVNTLLSNSSNIESILIFDLLGQANKIKDRINFIKNSIIQDNSAEA